MEGSEFMCREKAIPVHVHPFTLYTFKNRNLSIGPTRLLSVSEVPTVKIGESPISRGLYNFIE